MKRLDSQFNGNEDSRLKQGMLMLIESEAPDVDNDWVPGYSLEILKSDIGIYLKEIYNYPSQP